MTKPSQPPGRPGRRAFLFGLLTGGGSVGALVSRRAETASARPVDAAPSDPAGPVLYRRTEESERYYRTLYR